MEGAFFQSLDPNGMAMQKDSFNRLYYDGVKQRIERHQKHVDRQITLD
jgi:hypothetical protein